MAKATFAEFSTTPADNTEINSIGVQGTNAVQNFDNAFRELMAILRRDVPGLALANTFTKTQTWTKGSDVASATSLTLGDGNYFDVTGTTAITSIATKGVGTVVVLQFDGILTLTHHATDLILPGGANITTAAGDHAAFVEYASGDWRCFSYQRASGIPIAEAAPTSGEFLRGHLDGLTLSNNGSDATNDIDIATGSAGSDGTTPFLMTLSSALTKRLDASWAVGTGNGGLDTGSIANGFYYVWLIRRSDTGVVDALFSASATSPTMPTSYDQKRRIGTIWRESAAIRPFLQFGDRFMYSTQVLAAYTNTNLPTTKTTVTPSGSPTGIRTTALINGRASRGGGAVGVSIWCPDLTTPSTVDGASAMGSGANELQANAVNSGTAVSIGTNFQVLTDATGQIALQCAAATTQVSVQYLGFIDTRGR